MEPATKEQEAEREKFEEQAKSILEQTSEIYQLQNKGKVGDQEEEGIKKRREQEKTIPNPLIFLFSSKTRNLWEGKTLKRPERHISRP